jgi:hypothetical protein
MIGGLPQAYYQGQESQYQQRNQNLFQNPDNQAALNDALKNGNLAPLLQKVTEAGGAQAASQLFPLLKAAAGQNVANNAFGVGGQPQNTGPATSSAAAGPANITGGGGQPQTAADNGADTVRTLSASIGGEGRDIPGSVMDRIARSLGLPNADAGIPEGMLAAAKTRISGFLDRTSGNGIGGKPQANPVSSGGSGDEEGSANHLPPSGVGGSSAISPRPTSASGNIAGTPAPFNDRFSAAYGSGGAATNTGRQPLQVTVTPKPQDRVAQNAPPPAAAEGAPSLGDIQRYETSGNNKLRAAASYAVDAQQATALRDAGNKDLEIAKQLREQRSKWFEPTTEQKNLTSGAAAKLEAQKGDIASGQKEFDAITELGNNARISNQKVKLAGSFLNSDEYYSGPAEGLVKRYRQLAATFGGDPNAANPQEAFNKAINDLLSEQIRAMAKSGVGRVLMTEVQTMRDSIASQKMTPATNRLLLEEVNRIHKSQIDLQDAANAYVEKNGHLDAGFQRIVSKYYRDNPLFSDEELKDPRMIAPPTAPPGMDQVRAQQWIKSRGLSSGDPIRTQDGRVMYVP